MSDEIEVQVPIFEDPENPDNPTEVAGEGKKYRQWCFTDYVRNESVWTELDCAYIVFGREVCPTTGKKHLQGYFALKFQRTRSSLKKKNHPTAWFGVTKGTPLQASTYCKKTGDFYERGILPEPGKRNDLLDLTTMIRAGATDKEMVDEHPTRMFLYANNVVRFRAMLVPPRNFKTQVYWYWGPSETGKSRFAHHEAGLRAYSKDTSESFWDGYAGEEHVIIDELRVGDIPHGQLLKLFDRYPLRVKVKNASCQFVARRIWVTSSLHPREFVPHREEEKQLLRRITLIREFKRDE